MKRIILIFIIIFIFNCVHDFKKEEPEVEKEEKKEEKTVSKIEKYFSKTITDGFDFPVGNKDGKGKYRSIIDGKVYNSWYISTKFCEIYTEYKWIHTGEDWNGTGGGNTDLNQPVYSIANGEVQYAKNCCPLWGNIVLIKHEYIENGKLKTVFSQYSHLKEILVKKDQIVKRREKIGTIGQDPDKFYPAHLHLEIRKVNMKDYPVDYWPSSNGKNIDWVKEHYESPSEFISSHRNLTVPLQERKFIIAEKHRYKMFLYESGELVKTYEIALSQVPEGTKEKHGDLKLPEGEYKICEKKKGPFGNEKWWYRYLGPAWIKINYPNKFDAMTGLENKLISKKEYMEIIKAIENDMIPPQGTKLGGGIGIHGWEECDWDEDEIRDLTWGCISMHNKDIPEFYEWVETGVKIVIIP